MWSTVLTVLLSVAPILLSLVSLIVHFFVFHRLKCTKDLMSCIKECFPGYLEKNKEETLLGLLHRQIELSSKVDQLANFYECIISSLKKED